jgi:hypothetical protein
MFDAMLMYCHCSSFWFVFIVKLDYGDWETTLS